MINLTTCQYHNLTTNETAHDGTVLLKFTEEIAVPCVLLLAGTLVLAGIILVALVMSGCFKNPTSLLYFNLSLADALMAFTTIPLLLLPTETSSAWKTIQNVMSLIVFIPR